MPNHVLKADGVLVFVTILAAAGWFFSLFAMRGMPPLLFIAARFLLAGAVLSVLGWRALVRMNVRLVLRACLSGLAMWVSITLWAEAVVQTSNLGVGAFLSSLGNIAAPILGWVMFRTPIAPQTWWGVALAMAGMACMSLGKGGLSYGPADLMFLASAVAASLYLNFNSRFVARIPPLSLAAIQLSVVGLLSLAGVLVRGDVAVTLTPEVIGWFLASVLIATSLRYFLLVKGQKTAPISHAALIMILEPVWTALLAAVLLGSTITGLQLVGCLLIFLALVLHQMPWWRRSS